MAIIAGAQLALGLGSGIFAGRSERKARRKANAELRRRKRELKQTAAAASALVLDQSRAAAAPLERIAETTQDLRSPILREAISTGVRQQAEAESVRASSTGGALTGQRRAGNILQRLLSSQGLGASENARIQRTQANLALRAQLLQQSGAIRTEGASRAASIQTQAAGQIAGMPLQDQGPDTALFGGIGGLLSGLGELSDEDRGAFNEFLAPLFGSGNDGGFEFSQDIIDSTRSFGG